MDNLKSKVVSLELAKRMEKLGWEKETIFCWCIKDLFEDDEPQILIKPTEIAKKSGCTRIMMSPLFCEVWDELPLTIEYEKESYMKYVDGDNYVDYRSYTRECIICGEINEKPIQENAGELWCWLRENGYIEEE